MFFVFGIFPKAIVDFAVITEFAVWGSGSSVDAVWEIIIWSFKALEAGAHPLTDHRGEAWLIEPFMSLAGTPPGRRIQRYVHELPCRCGIHILPLGPARPLVFPPPMSHMPRRRHQRKRFADALPLIWAVCIMAFDVVYANGRLLRALPRERQTRAQTPPIPRRRWHGAPRDGVLAGHLTLYRLGGVNARGWKRYVPVGVL